MVRCSPLRLASLALLLLGAACSGKPAAEPAADPAGTTEPAGETGSEEPTTSGGGTIGGEGEPGDPGGTPGGEGSPGSAGTAGTAGTAGAPGGSPGGTAGDVDAGVAPVTDAGPKPVADAGVNPMCTGGAKVEAEPNDTRAAATPITVGATCGTVGGADAVDTLAFRLEAGKRYEWRYTSDVQVRVTNQQVGDEVFLEIRPGTNRASNWRFVLEAK